jgi:hypothetical protein
VASMMRSHAIPVAFHIPRRNDGAAVRLSHIIYKAIGLRNLPSSSRSTVSWR